MDHDPLLHLLDHPAPDADAPRNPVLTHQVMERVRQVAASQRVAKADHRPWLLGAAVVALLALAAPFAGVVGDGGLGEAASLVDPEQMLELGIGTLTAALIAVGVLARSWRRTP